MLQYFSYTDTFPEEKILLPNAVVTAPLRFGLVEVSLSLSNEVMLT